MLSVKKRDGVVLVRMHRIFLSADSTVMEEIADFIKNSKIKTPRINVFIRQNSHQLKKRTLRKVSLKTEGRCYSLLEIFCSINREYFDDRVAASITWGSRGPRRAAARRTLGSYCSDNSMIRINPLLDNRGVPRYFLELVVYHEMLHADMGVEKNGARRTVHSREFKRREKTFRHYDRAIAWEKKRW